MPTAMRTVRSSAKRSPSTKPTHGGRRKGAGRPRGSTTAEPTVVLSLRVTAQEMSRLRARCGPLTMGQYLRVALLLDRP